MELWELAKNPDTETDVNEPGKTQDSTSASAQTPATGAVAAGVAQLVAAGSPERGLSG